MLESGLDAGEVLKLDGSAIALAGGDGVAVVVDEIEGGAYAECFGHVAGHGLADGGVVLDPVELPDVPEVGITDGGAAGAVVRGREVIAEDDVANARECVGAAVAALDGIEPGRGGASEDFYEVEFDGGEVVPEGALVGEGAGMGAEDAGREAVELERIDEGFGDG